MTNLLDIDLTAKTAVELRKIGAQAGVKGASKGKKADLLAALLPMQDAQRAERDAKSSEKLETFKSGRSRAGMVIVAKGTEVHKGNTFKEAAEAAGWDVKITSGGEDYFATATKGDNVISLAWQGRAYDYPASSASFGGKSRKVRNLKEALRLL